MKAAMTTFAGGTVPPLVTPLSADGQVDTASLVRFARALADAGCDGFLALGSTGEGPHLDAAAAEQVVGTLVDSGTLPVMANAAALSTDAAVASARRSRAAGAHAILAPPPSGFPLSQDELGAHFEAIAEAVGQPIFAYHVPARVPTQVTPALVARLVDRGVLAGVKDSSGDLDNHRRTKMAAGERAVLYSGSESCIDAAVLLGFDGAVPGLANVYPRAEVQLVATAKAGDLAQARQLQEAIVERQQLYFAPVGAASFTAVALGVLKLALVQAGIFETATLSAPLSPVCDELRQHVAEHLERYPVDIVPAP